MNKFKCILLVALLVLVAAGNAYAVSTTFKLTVQNDSDQDIEAELTVNNGSGGGTATIAPNESHSFSISHTVYYAKHKTYNDVLGIKYNGESVVSCALEFTNYMNYLGASSLSVKYEVTNSDSQYHCLDGLSGTDTDGLTGFKGTFHFGGCISKE